VTLDGTNFQAEVLNSKGLTLVDFWAVWCGPCQVLGPIIEAIAEEIKDTVTVGKLNVDENPELAAQYGVMSIPTVILFKDGQPVEQVVGVRAKQDYLELIEKHAG